MKADDEDLKAWRWASFEAGVALERWKESHAEADFLAYRAAQDREDAAQDALLPAKVA